MIKLYIVYLVVMVILILLLIWQFQQGLIDYTNILGGTEWESVH